MAFYRGTPQSSSALVGGSLALHNHIKTLLRSGRVQGAVRKALESAVYANEGRRSPACADHVDGSPVRAKALALIASRDASSDVNPRMKTHHALFPSVFTCNDLMSAVHPRLSSVLPLFAFFFIHMGISPNITSYNHIINSYCCAGNIEASLAVYRHIISVAPFRPSAVTYRHLVRALIDSHRIPDALLLLGESYYRGHARYPDSLAYNYVIAGLVREGNLPKALQVFAELRESCPSYDAVVHATIMDGYFRMGNEHAAMLSYHHFLTSNARITPSGVNTLLATLLQNNKAHEAHDFFYRVLKSHFPPHSVTVNGATYTIMINYCFQEGRFTDAVKLFNTISPKPTTENNKYRHLDVDCFTNIICKLCEENLTLEAEKVIHTIPARLARPVYGKDFRRLTAAIRDSGMGHMVDELFLVMHQELID